MTDKPIRVQLHRTKGWRLPENTISVARPTMFGNLWKVGLKPCGCRSAGECGHNTFRRETAAEAVEEFRVWWLRRLSSPLPKVREKAKYELTLLRGRNLACWCKEGAPCHADVLLELANRDES